MNSFVEKSVELVVFEQIVTAFSNPVDVYYAEQLVNVVVDPAEDAGAADNVNPGVKSLMGRCFAHFLSLVS